MAQLGIIGGLIVGARLQQLVGLTVMQQVCADPLHFHGFQSLRVCDFRLVVRKVFVQTEELGHACGRTKMFGLADPIIQERLPNLRLDVTQAGTNLAELARCVFIFEYGCRLKCGRRITE